MPVSCFCPALWIPQTYSCCRALLFFGNWFLWHVSSCTRFPPTFTNHVFARWAVPSWLSMTANIQAATRGANVTQHLMDTIVDVVGAIKFVGRTIHYQELAVLMHSPAQGMTVIGHQNCHLTSLGVLKVPIRANKIATHITFQRFWIFLLYNSGKGTDSFSWRIVVFDHWSILQFCIGILQEILQARPWARRTCQWNVPKPHDLGFWADHTKTYKHMTHDMGHMVMWNQDLPKWVKDVKIIIFILQPNCN